MVVQNYDCLALIVEQAFGGKKSTKAQPKQVVSTAADMMGAMQGLFG